MPNYFSGQRRNAKNKRNLNIRGNIKFIYIEYKKKKGIFGRTQHFWFHVQRRRMQNLCAKKSMKILHSTAHCLSIAQSLMSHQSKNQIRLVALVWWCIPYNMVIYLAKISNDLEIKMPIHASLSLVDEPNWTLFSKTKEPRHRKSFILKLKLRKSFFSIYCCYFACNRGILQFVYPCKKFTTKPLCFALEIKRDLAELFLATYNFPFLCSKVLNWFCRTNIVNNNCHWHRQVQTVSFIFI